jgi:hypothetical protein
MVTRSKSKEYFSTRKCEHESMWTNDFKIFADMLDILAVPTLHDVNQPPGRASISTHTICPLAVANNHLPAVFESSQAPKTSCGRGAESAADTGIDTLVEANRNRHALGSSSSNGGFHLR